MISRSSYGCDPWLLRRLSWVAVVVQAELQVKSSGGISFRETGKWGGRANRAKGNSIHVLFSRARMELAQQVFQMLVGRDGPGVLSRRDTFVTSRYRAHQSFRFDLSGNRVGNRPTESNFSRQLLCEQSVSQATGQGAREPLALRRSRFESVPGTGYTSPGSGTSRQTRTAQQRSAKQRPTHWAEKTSPKSGK